MLLWRLKYYLLQHADEFSWPFDSFDCRFWFFIRLSSKWTPNIPPEISHFCLQRTCNILKWFSNSRLPFYSIKLWLKWQVIGVNLKTYLRIDALKWFLSQVNHFLTSNSCPQRLCFLIICDRSTGICGCINYFRLATFTKAFQKDVRINFIRHL